MNYDFPQSIEDYIHRIGRTGRAGNTGDSFSLFTMRDGGLANDLINVTCLDKAHEEGEPASPEGLVQNGGEKPIQK